MRNPAQLSLAGRFPDGPWAFSLPCCRWFHNPDVVIPAFLDAVCLVAGAARFIRHPFAPDIKHRSKLPQPHGLSVHAPADEFDFDCHALMLPRFLASRKTFPLTAFQGAAQWRHARTSLH